MPITISPERINNKTQRENEIWQIDEKLGISELTACMNERHNFEMQTLLLMCLRHVAAQYIARFGINIQNYSRLLVKFRYATTILELRCAASPVVRNPDPQLPPYDYEYE